MSLETVEDVAIHLPTGHVILEQMKSASSHNPLSDWAPDFWKTVGHWVSSGAAADPNYCFRFYVTPLKAGGLPQLLGNASTKQEIDDAVAAVKTALASLKKKLPGCLPHLNLFLKMSDADKVSFVKRLTVINELDPIASVRNRLGIAFEPTVLQIICEASIGFAKEEGDALLRLQQPGMIAADKFLTKVRAYAQKVNLPGLLVSVADTPGQEELSTWFWKRPTFIRQLELINATRDESIRAISDFLRASSDKVSWAEKGHVFKKSFDEMDDHLIASCGAISGEVNLTHAQHQPAQRGRIVYLRCTRIQAPIEGRTVPGHFVHGCLNELADRSILGWHPDYDTMLG
ncbi:ABC-three component system protein [Acidisoma cladoniae]|uniref:ABC-three component system protein n=1 Tax=Acidisoma cladoniae TaxID=3040935 RepID=UPI002550E870|nr:ABC-three component system protein [Acidisoma sp. PAMC 29798]